MLGEYGTFLANWPTAGFRPVGRGSRLPGLRGEGRELGERVKGRRSEGNIGSRKWSGAQKPYVFFPYLETREAVFRPARSTLHPAQQAFPQTAQNTTFSLYLGPGRPVSSLPGQKQSLFSPAHTTSISCEGALARPQETWRRNHTVLSQEGFVFLLGRAMQTTTSTYPPRR